MPPLFTLSGWIPTAVAVGAAGVVLAVFFRVASRLEVIAKHQRALRLQMSNLLSMLRRAGFKIAPPGKPDWGDDYLKTQIMREDDDSWWTRKSRSRKRGPSTED